MSRVTRATASGRSVRQTWRHCLRQEIGASKRASCFPVRCAGSPIWSPAHAFKWPLWRATSNSPLRPSRRRWSSAAPAGYWLPRPITPPSLSTAARDVLISSRSRDEAACDDRRGQTKGHSCPRFPLGLHRVTAGHIDWIDRAQFRSNSLYLVATDPLPCDSSTRVCAHSSRLGRWPVFGRPTQAGLARCCGARARRRSLTT